MCAKLPHQRLKSTRIHSPQWIPPRRPKRIVSTTQANRIGREISPGVWVVEAVPVVMPASLSVFVLPGKAQVELERFVGCIVCIGRMRRADPASLA